MRATYHPNPVLRNFIVLIILGEEYKLRSSSLCSVLHSPVTSSLFCPNVLLFSNTLSLCSSLNVRDQVSHPYRTTGKIIVLYILISAFLDWTGLDQMVTSITRIQSAFNILKNKMFISPWLQNISILPYFQNNY
jgi:hypothetical protein